MRTSLKQGPRGRPSTLDRESAPIQSLPHRISPVQAPPPVQRNEEAFTAPISGRMPPPPKLHMPVPAFVQFPPSLPSSPAAPMPVSPIVQACTNAHRHIDTPKEDSWKTFIETPGGSIISGSQSLERVLSNGPSTGAMESFFDFSGYVGNDVNDGMESPISS